MVSAQRDFDAGELSRESEPTDLASQKDRRIAAKDIDDLCDLLEKCAARLRITKTHLQKGKIIDFVVLGSIGLLVSILTLLLDNYAVAYLSVKPIILLISGMVPFFLLFFFSRALRRRLIRDDRLLLGRAIEIASYASRILDINRNLSSGQRLRLKFFLEDVEGEIQALEKYMK